MLKTNASVLPEHIFAFVVIGAHMEQYFRERKNMNSSSAFYVLVSLTGCRKTWNALKC